MKFLIILVLTLFSAILTNEAYINKAFKLTSFAVKIKNRKKEHIFKCFDTVSLVAPIYSKISNEVKPVEGVSYDEALKLEGASSYGLVFTLNQVKCPKNEIDNDHFLEKAGNKYILPFTSISEIPKPVNTPRRELHFTVMKNYIFYLYFTDDEEGQEAREFLYNIVQQMDKEVSRRFGQTLFSLEQFKPIKKSKKHAQEVEQKEKEIQEQREVYKKQIEKYIELSRQINAYEKELNELTTAKTNIEDKINTNSKVMEEINEKKSKLELSKAEASQMTTDVEKIKEVLNKLAPFKTEKQISELKQSLDEEVKSKKELTEFLTKINTL